MTDRTDCAPLVAEDRWAPAVSPQAQKPPSMRAFGVIMVVGFGILGGLSLWSWRRTGADWRLVLAVALLAVGVVIFIWSLVSPRSLPPVHRAWMRFGQTIGTVVSTILLTALYVVAVAPIGWLMRLTGTDPIDRRVLRGEGTYWKRHGPLDAPADYSHMS